MIVKPASRIDSAISFGVFCRFAPSTSAIIRSRNVSPALAVIFTTISSDSTRVPPVTAERSPPDSRMTGADSPVIADSSTVAMPSTTSPSPGITSPADTTQRSPRSSCEDALSTIDPSGSRTRAVVSARVFLSVAACALPRPSAIASAKLANRTVNQSHAATSAANAFWVPVESPQSRMARSVVTSAPTSTMNITGFFIKVRGSSLRNESALAGRTMAGSKIERDAEGLDRTFGVRSVGGNVVVAIRLLLQLQVLDKGAQRNCGEERETSDDDDHSDQQAHELRRVGREGSGGHRHLWFRGE